MHALIVTDMHVGEQVPKKRYGDQALPLAQKVVDTANQKKVHCVIDLGDRVPGGNREIDLANMRSLMSVFDRLDPGIRRIHVLGNHDIDTLTAAENEEITGTPARSFFIDEENARYVAWMPEFPEHPDFDGVDVDRVDLEYLDDTLNTASQNRVIVFSHAPLDYETGELLRKGKNPHHSFYRNGAAILEIFRRCAKQTIGVAGHMHDLRYIQDHGTRSFFLTLPSLIQAGPYHLSGGPGGAYTEMTANDFATIFTLYNHTHDGRPEIFRIPAPASGFHPV